MVAETAETAGLEIKMQACVIPELDPPAAARAALKQDRAYFEQNPRDFSYVRPAVPGEFWPVEVPDGAEVYVLRFPGELPYTAEDEAAGELWPRRGVARYRKVCEMVAFDLFEEDGTDPFPNPYQDDGAARPHSSFPDPWADPAP
jgi:hypothetical protein